jgi:MFS family permease
MTRLIDYDQNDVKKGCFDFSPRTKGIMCIVGSILLQLFNGCFFMWANISVYVISFIYKTDKSIRSDAVFIVDFFLISLNVTGYSIGMYLLNHRKWSPRRIVAFGCTIALAGKLASSYFVGDLWVFVSLYALLGGIGNGITYMMPLVSCWEHFPNSKGLMTGVVVGSYGLGSFIFNRLSTDLVNPTNGPATIIIDKDTKYFDASIADRVPNMLRTLVLVWAIISICAVVLFERADVKTEENTVDEEQQ